MTHHARRSPLLPYTTLFRSSPVNAQTAAPPETRTPAPALVETDYTPSQSDSQLPENPTPSPALLVRSEEHTSELQSRGHIVCRLLLEKKNQIYRYESDRQGC